MAYGAPYNSTEETYVRNLLIHGETEQAQRFIQTDSANMLIDLPSRVQTQLHAIKDLYGLSTINSNQQYITNTLKPLEEIDSLIVAEVKRRSSKNWLIIMFVARLLNRKPKQRIITFENTYTKLKYYTITCSSRQRLIEQVFDKRILPATNAHYSALISAEFSSAPLGSLQRKILKGDYLPLRWDVIHIRLFQADPLADLMAAMEIDA